jgi:hypothetical protein
MTCWTLLQEVVVTKEARTVFRGPSFATYGQLRIGTMSLFPSFGLGAATRKWEVAHWAEQEESKLNKGTISRGYQYLPRMVVSTLKDVWTSYWSGSCAAKHRTRPPGRQGVDPPCFWSRFSPWAIRPR